MSLWADSYTAKTDGELIAYVHCGCSPIAWPATLVYLARLGCCCTASLDYFRFLDAGSNHSDILLIVVGIMNGAVDDVALDACETTSVAQYGYCVYLSIHRWRRLIDNRIQGIVSYDSTHKNTFYLYAYLHAF